MPGSSATARRLSFHALTVLAVLVCVVAARWQWQRAHRTEADAVPQSAVVALADLDPATAYSGMRVRLVGQFDVAHEVLVAPRPRDGQPGAWVLTPLVPTAPTGRSDGGVAGPGGAAGVAVVRGWVPAGAEPALPPGGPVEVVGVLVADSRQPGATVSPEGTLEAVDTGALAEHAGYPVRSGWFALQGLTPASAGQPAPLEVTELPGAEVGLNLRNAAYAIQWIVFAGFGLFFWNRFRHEYVEHPVEQEIPR